MNLKMFVPTQLTARRVPTAKGFTF